MVCGGALQMSVLTVHFLRTPAVLCTWMVLSYVVSGVLNTFTFHLLSFVVHVFTCCILALVVSWLLLHYGNGSDDVISAIDDIANFLFPLVSQDIDTRNSSARMLRLCSGYFCDATAMPFPRNRATFMRRKEVAEKSHGSCVAVKSPLRRSCITGLGSA